MPLVIAESEKAIILKGLRRLAHTSAIAQNLLETLSENPDCTEWHVLTKEETVKR